MDHQSKAAPAFSASSLWVACLCGAMAIGSACSRSSGDPLDEIRELQARNQYEASIEDLRALRDEDPSDPDVNYLLAKALMVSGEPSMAIWPLQRAVESPKYAFDAGMMLARAALESRSPDDAIEAVDAALAAKPDDVEALAFRALAKIEASRSADALADVERAVELDPDNGAVMVPRVLVLLELDRVDEAEAVLGSGAHTAESAGEPTGEEILARLCLTNAAFAVERDDRKSAEVMYADCLDAYPTDPLVVLAIVDFYDSIGRGERATELLRRAFVATRDVGFGYALSQRARRPRHRERPLPRDLSRA